jgi:hypothetical protein
MSRSISLEDSIRQANHDIHHYREVSPEYSKWLEDCYLPGKLLEYLGRPDDADLLKLRSFTMNITTLMNSPHGTKMTLPVTVVSNDKYQSSQYGYWCNMIVSDTSGQQKIMYSAGDPMKNPVYPEPGQQVTLKLTRKDNGQYRNISGYATNEKPEQSLPPAPSDPQASPHPSSSPTRAETPPQGNGQSYRGEDPKQFAAKQKAIIVQVAARIVSEQQIAGKNTGETSQAVQFWADIIWTVCKNLGTDRSIPPFQPNEEPGPGEDPIPY